MPSLLIFLVHLNKNDFHQNRETVSEIFFQKKKEIPAMFPVPLITQEYIRKKQGLKADSRNRISIKKFVK